MNHKQKLDKDNLIKNVYEANDAGYRMTVLKAGTKEALRRDWPNLRLEPQSIIEYVHQQDANVAILNGAPSDWSVDIDIDMPGLLSIAPLVLPPTDAIFGRESNPGSHYLYRVASGSPLSIVQNKLGHKMAAEIRGNGYTLMPGSMHPSGEIYTGDISKPALVDFRDLKDRVGMMCALNLLLLAFPGKGSRHEYAFCFDGLLANAGYPQSSASFIVRNLAELTGDEELDDREACVASSYASVEAGQLCKGRSGLTSFMKESEIKALERYLGLGRGIARPHASPLAPVLGSDGEMIQIPGLKMNRTTNEIKATRDNVRLILKTHDDWEGVLCWNLRGDRVDFVKKPPFDVEGDFPMALTDKYVLQVCNWMAIKYGLDLSVSTAREALKVRAFDNAYDPVVVYLRECGANWDGTKRLDTMLVRYFGADDIRFVRIVGAKWMKSAVARAMEPGCKVDHVLVLEGGQGAKKGTALNILGGRYYAGDPPSLNANSGKAIQEWCHQEVWIAEFSELDAMRKSEATQTKSFLTTREDRFRPSYGSIVETRPRRFVFAATTNESEYLRDRTGNRRFWPVSIKHKMDLDALRIDRDQIWGEAVTRYDNGETWWLNDDEECLAAEEQRSRLVSDPLEPLILEVAEDCAKDTDFVDTGLIQLLLETKHKAHGAPHSLAQRIAHVLTDAGWKAGRHRDASGRALRGYRPPKA